VPRNASRVHGLRTLRGAVRPQRAARRAVLVHRPGHRREAEGKHPRPWTHNLACLKSCWMAQADLRQHQQQEVDTGVTAAGSQPCSTGDRPAKRQALWRAGVGVRYTIARPSTVERSTALVTVCGRSRGTRRAQIDPCNLYGLVWRI
jgi:hypothetical protein